ncbi:hypothetical protein SUGI_0593050 [Cryptomeria japonica]|nr:hypothetical protein SUGI_0593050 [Cryptomeria japonica]
MDFNCNDSLHLEVVTYMKGTITNLNSQRAAEGLISFLSGSSADGSWAYWILACTSSNHKMGQKLKLHFHE